MRLALFDFRQAVDYRLEILSGLTVAMALIPEAVAFVLIAGLSPLPGLYAAFMVGLVARVLGGRPGIIGGATGVVAALVFAWGTRCASGRGSAWTTKDGSTTSCTDLCSLVPPRCLPKSLTWR